MASLRRPPCHGTADTGADDGTAQSRRGIRSQPLEAYTSFIWELELPNFGPQLVDLQPRLCESGAGNFAYALCFDFDFCAVRQNLHLVVMRSRMFFKTHRNGDHVIRLYARGGNNGLLKK